MLACSEILLVTVASDWNPVYVRTSQTIAFSTFSPLGLWTFVLQRTAKTKMSRNSFDATSCRLLFA